MAGIIVAQITPAADGAAPTFKILRDYERDATARPCEHREFILDEKWSSVTCGACGERVDAFSALLRFAEWYDKLESRRRSAEEAETRMHHAELKRLSRLRDASDEERQEVGAATGWNSKLSAAELRALVSRISRDIRERKNARRGNVTITRNLPDIHPQRPRP